MRPNRSPAPPPTRPSIGWAATCSPAKPDHRTPAPTDTTKGDIRNDDPDPTPPGPRRPAGTDRCRHGPGPCPGHLSAAAHQVHRALSGRSEEHTSELQSPCNLVCRLLLEKKKKKRKNNIAIEKKPIGTRQTECQLPMSLNDIYI